VLYTLFGYALFLVGRQAEMGRYYWYALGAALVLVVYEFTVRALDAIARDASRRSCTTTGSGWWWFAGFAQDFALRK
jgi:4-hydroxybenzoate polyprenyltransferase